MMPKAHINPALILIPTVIVLLLGAVLARPVNAGRGIVLRPPFNGTYRVTSYFDHDRPNYGIGADGYIWIYSGERVVSSYNGKTGEPYPYDGHDGWDFNMTTGTHVLAAASGTVVVAEWGNWGNGFGRTIIIDHGNGYYTQYSHLSNLLVGQGNQVSVNQYIADSGNTGNSTGDHLHFSVRQDGYANTTYAIDPFGWRGNQRDPLFNYNGKESSCLWAGGPGANISCADFIVEDDGAGWSQNGAWFESTTGNGFRQHWTYSWNPASDWAKWTPALPYQGVYQIQAFIAYVNATTTNARYEIHQPYGTTIAPINQANISDNWASLGTFFLNPATAYVQLYDYTGEPNYSKQVAADSLKFSASIVHLPYVRNNQNGWVTSITVRNNSASTAQGTINYYQQSGGQVSYTPFTIAGNGTILLTPLSTFDGAAVVVADQDVSVVVREENATRQELNEYNGILAAGGSPGWEQASTTVYVPLIKNARYGRSSKLFIMNTGLQATVASVEFFNADTGQSMGSPATYPLNVNASQPVNATNCGAGNRCSAKITSSAGQPLAVAVLEKDDATTAYRATYSGFSSGATQNFAPVVKRNRYGRTTGLVIENVGTTAANISMTCYDLTGGSYNCGFYTNLPSKATFVLTPLNVPDNFVGSALVTSSGGQPIVTTIYESGSPQQQVTNAPLNGTGYAYVPELYGNYVLGGQTWNSGIAIQNTGAGNAAVTVTYYNQAGAQVDVETVTGLQQNRVWILNRSANNLPDNFAGSAVITANQPVVAIANHLHIGNGDTTASYTVPNR